MDAGAEKRLLPCVWTRRGGRFGVAFGGGWSVAEVCFFVCVGEGWRGSG